MGGLDCLKMFSQFYFFISNIFCEANYKKLAVKSDLSLAYLELLLQRFMIFNLISSQRIISEVLAQLNLIF